MALVAASISSIYRSSKAIAAAVKKGVTGITTSPSTFFSYPFPISITSSYSNTAKLLSPDDPSSRTQFLNFVKDRCKSKNLKLDDALGWFNRMLLMRPLPPVEVFNYLLGVVARTNHHSTVLALYLRLRMNSVGLCPAYLL
eukprot:TRINITY_DN11099_c1_g1_i3.p1 TRINITY_DN11099_c1_g1~~TRINITY_DN11099_c1_g1_i3.p1  ORF type:complete len:141 (+),score=14.39 TRINITY_DN11099_c1_g1_i3:97-519(+)